LRRAAALPLLILLALAVPVDGAAAETLSAGGCSVRLLGPADADEVLVAYRDSVVEPSARDRDSIRDALPLLPRLSCEAVKRVVFVQRAKNQAEDGWVNANAPDVVFINYAGSNTRAKVSQAFLHESTHAADLLLQAHKADTGLLDGLLAEDLFPDGEASADDWGPAARALAGQAVTDNRLGIGFRAEWLRLHRNFRDFGIAGDYLVPETVVRERVVDGETVEVEETALPALAAPETAGFMSNYGATSPGEDIAEFAGWMLAAPLYAAAEEGSRAARERHDHACRAMQASPTATIGRDIAVLFTKANLLLSAGVVTPAAYQACVGRLGIEAPGKGVWVYGVDAEAADLKRSFTGDVRVSVGTHAQLEQYVFEYRASGQAPFGDKLYGADLSLRLGLAPADRELSLVSWPRGLYSLKHIANRFDVNLPDNRHGSFVGTDGIVLVSHASNHRIEGSIFLQSAVRVLTTPPVPQTGLPLRFLFKIEK
jgi:hypothetical protein